MLSIPLITYVLTAALRDKLFTAIFLALVVGAAVAVFLGSAAVVEQDRFSLVFAAAGLRFTGVAGLTLFIVFYIRRAFENKDVDFLLSRPLSRTAFLLSHAAAFALLALAAAIAVTAVVAALPVHSAPGGLFLWGASIAAEFIIMATAALFFSMVLSSATGAALAVFGFYILARMIGELLGIVHEGLFIHGFHLMAGIMNVIALLVPRLDLMAQSSWLVYGPDNIAGAGFVVLQGVLYTALLTLAALVDLVRRQF